MLTLPVDFAVILMMFASDFTKPAWEHVKFLFVGVHSRARKTDRHFRFTDCWFKPGKTFSKLSSCAESSCLVRLKTQSHIAFFVDQNLRPVWPCGPGPG